VVEKQLPEQADKLGAQFIEGLRGINSPLVKEVRGRGLLIGMEMANERVTARDVCEALMAKGILSKETHETVVRFAPPLVITAPEIEGAVETVAQVLQELA
jgi:ornithine--oxo-acid transaminase